MVVNWRYLQHSLTAKGHQEERSSLRGREGEVPKGIRHQVMAINQTRPRKHNNRKNSCNETTDNAVVNILAKRTQQRNDEHLRVPKIYVGFLNDKNGISLTKRFGHHSSSILRVAAPDAATSFHASSAIFRTPLRR